MFLVHSGLNAIVKKSILKTFFNLGLGPELFGPNSTIGTVKLFTNAITSNH